MRISSAVMLAPERLVAAMEAARPGRKATRLEYDFAAQDGVDGPGFQPTLRGSLVRLSKVKPGSNENLGLTLANQQMTNDR